MSEGMNVGEALVVMQGELKRAQAWRKLEGVLAAAVTAEARLPALRTEVAKEEAALEAAKARTVAAENAAAQIEGHLAEVTGLCNAEISRVEAAHQERLTAMRDEEAAARGLLADVRADLAAARAKLA